MTKQIDVEKFVQENSLTLARTPEEVLARIKVMQKRDVMGFSLEILVDYLPWEHAKALFQEQWVKDVGSGKEEKPPEPDLLGRAREFLRYMEFAWGKAVDQRGISASRSIFKLGEHMWCLGREDLHDVLHDDSLYAPYGAPALIECCEKLGVEVPSYVREFAADPSNAYE